MMPSSFDGNSYLANLSMTSWAGPVRINAKRLRIVSQGNSMFGVLDDAKFSVSHTVERRKHFAKTLL